MQIPNSMRKSLDKSQTVLQKMNQWIDATIELPSKPMPILKLMRMVNSINTFSKDLVTALAQDKDLATELIKSAKMGTQISSSNIQRSIQRLGYRLLQNEVEVAYIKKFARALIESKNTHLTRELRYSIKTAIIAKEIAYMAKHDDPASAFFAGLTHNIGQMVIGLRDRHAMDEIKKMTQAGFAQKEAEMVILGFEHSELAAKLLNRWDMPQEFIELARKQDNLSDVDIGSYELALMMQLARYLARELTNKEGRASATWDKAYGYLKRLGIETNRSEWQERIQTIYIQILNCEDRVFMQI